MCCSQKGHTLKLSTRDSHNNTNADGHVVYGKLPGIRCPTCAASGKEIWVAPGRLCSICGTPIG